MIPARPVLLVLRALGLGDLLTAVPALRGLAVAFPGHTKVLAAPEALAPLALGTGCVDRVLDAAPLGPLPAEMPRPDVAVNLHGRGPESHRVLLATDPRHLIAFAQPEVPESRRGPAWREDEHEVARWCRLLEVSGVPADPSLLHITAPTRAVPVTARRATLLHPGAASPARRWPPERWAAVARHEARGGRNVIVTGGPGEVDSARRVARLGGLDDSAVLAGATDVAELAALVAAAARVVCGDTGVAHLATALGTPSVVLFGPTSPTRWGPPGDRARHRVLWAGTEGDPHARSVDPGLLRLTVTDVIAALDDLEEGERALAEAGVSGT